MEGDNTYIPPINRPAYLAKSTKFLRGEQVVQELMQNVSVWLCPNGTNFREYSQYREGPAGSKKIAILVTQEKFYAWDLSFHPERPNTPNICISFQGTVFVCKALMFS